MTHRGLHLPGTQVGTGSNVLSTTAGGMVTKAVYGAKCSIMLATREAGYHSRPHRHMSEQVNYVVDGEVWAFIDDMVFLARQGDFFRIPANAVHWAWNRGDGPVTTFQAFSPVLDPYTRKNSAPLLGESTELTEYHETVHIDDEAPYLALERRWLADLERGQGELSPSR